MHKHSQFWYNRTCGIIVSICSAQAHLKRGLFLYHYIGNKVKITVCQDCGDVYDYTGYPTCPECIRDGDTTKKEIPKLLQKEPKNAIQE